MYLAGNDTEVTNVQKGQGVVEYALIIAFVVAVSVVILVTRPELARGIGAIVERAVSLLEAF